MFFSAVHRLPDSFPSICDVFLCGVNPSLSILSHLHVSLAAASGFSEPQVSNHRELVLFSGFSIWISCLRTRPSSPSPPILRILV